MIAGVVWDLIQYLENDPGLYAIIEAQDKDGDVVHFMMVPYWWDSIVDFKTYCADIILALSFHQATSIYLRIAFMNM